MAEKDLKAKAREAVKRMKSGFWNNYKERIVELREIAKSEGIEMSRVVDIFDNTHIKSKTIKNSEDEFYSKVKAILDTDGEVSNAIGRLIDKDYYDTLEFDARQKYVFEISRKYREAVERYKREKMLMGDNS